MEISKADSPISFFEMIPTNLVENIAFRVNLHQKLEADKGFQKVFIEMVLDYPPLFYNSIAWTFNPRKPRGQKNLPFILRPAQIDAVEAIDKAFKEHYNAVLDKTRDEGATELITKYFAMHFLFNEQTQFLVGSRKAEFVDKGVELIGDKIVGAHKTLFHKLLYGVHTAPNWAKPENYLKTFMLLQNLDNGSVISGESTNENFGAGDRQSAVLVDELGRIEHRVARALTENLSDVTDSTFYCSTHFYGAAHPYNQLITQKIGDIKVIVLPWERNPEKNEGLYLSPNPGIIQIKDIDYYRDICPSVFNEVIEMQDFNVEVHEEELQQHDITFVADGGDRNEKGWRSVWYDHEETERSARNMAANIDRRAVGSGDTFFSLPALARMEEEHCRRPDHVGDIKLDSTITDNDKLIINSAAFIDNKRGKLQWWGKLVDGRPRQDHNYIIACDISRGTGASNSVAGIYDVNTSEKVGIWVDALTSPQDFADLTVGMCKWVGGSYWTPYLIWEGNGPGDLFEQRVVHHGYSFVYIRRTEGKIRKKKMGQRGWWSSREGKRRLLQDLDGAIDSAIKKDKTRKKLIIHDADSIREYENYIEYTAGGCGPARLIEESDNARALHGDRVIPDGLFVLASTIQPEAVAKKEKKRPKHCVGTRLEKRRQAAREKSLNKRFPY